VVFQIFSYGIYTSLKKLGFEPWKLWRYHMISLRNMFCWWDSTKIVFQSMGHRDWKYKIYVLI
jgi:hypothetical protein